MLKLLGIGLLLSGTAGIGFGKAKELDQRVEELRMLRQFVMLLEGEIAVPTGRFRNCSFLWGNELGPLFSLFSQRPGGRWNYTRD